MIDPRDPDFDQIPGGDTLFTLILVILFLWATLKVAEALT